MKKEEVPKEIKIAIGQMFLEGKSKDEINGFIESQKKHHIGRLYSKETARPEYDVLDNNNTTTLVYNSPDWTNKINLTPAISLTETGDDRFTIKGQGYCFHNLSIGDIATIRLLLNTVNALKPNWFCKYRLVRKK